MSRQAVFVPDIGGESADVIEILVKAGDSVGAEQSIIVLESAKASMEIPCPLSGTVAEIAVQLGQSVKEGDLVLHVELLAAAIEKTSAALATHIEASQKVSALPVSAVEPAVAQALPVLSATTGRVHVVKVPDIGSENADVIEILVKAGDTIALEQSLVVLESAKASMEVPNTVAGVVQRILANVGDKVSENTALIEVLSAVASATSVTATSKTVSIDAPVTTMSSAVPTGTGEVSGGDAKHRHDSPVHAGPAVRRLARELGADLAKIKGSGPRQRILKDDVHAFVKRAMTETASKKEGSFGLPALPSMDFGKWGEIERVELTKIQKLSAQNLHRAWISIPHVTQFDEADITDLEDFRAVQKESLKAQGVSLTILAFLVKASAHVLKQYPKFTSSLDTDGAHLIHKKYIHIGVAVDTPNGLVVPVIRDANKKSVGDIARDLGELSKKARDKKLMPADMQGAVFSISSLGGIGGTAFTPIVNWPEVAILGVSRAATKPVWDGRAFQPRLLLPLSLSYDHRVIDGADAARFTSALVGVLSDIRQVLL